MSEQEKNFYKKFEIKVLDSNKRCITHMNYSFFSDPADKDLIYTESNTTTEKLLTLTIPESKLNDLIQLYQIVYNNRNMAGHNDMFQVVLDQIQEERSLRQQYPALQESYEHYSTLLYLTGHQKKIPL
jgi:hypothetical protein